MAGNKKVNIKKRVFIIHGWGGTPNDDWLPWLKKELKLKKFDVQVLKMPSTNYPKIGEWTSFLGKKVKKLDRSTFMIGHSIGCQTIIRYLEDQKNNFGGAILVAGWFDLKDLETKDEEKIARPWIKTPIDFKKIKNKGKFVAIFSNDDPVVDIKNSKRFKSKLGAKVFIMDKMGHFNKSDGVTDLPIVIDELLKMAK